MNIAVIGSNGQLGSDLVETFVGQGWRVVGLDHSAISVEDEGNVRSVLQGIRPDVVVNTAAYHNVPLCEKDPNRSFQVNALGALHVARMAGELGAVCVHYSTDYVFDGLKGSPYVEEDLPRPLNIYGGTKHLGEEFVLAYAPKPLVLRVSGIYGKVPCRAKGGNFIMTMRKAARERPEVKVVDDEILTPTSTVEIARASVGLVKAGATGLFHMTAEGECSWYDFARVIFETLHLATPLLPVKSREFPSPVRRPLYSVLENRRLNALGVPPMAHWKDALIHFLQSSVGTP